MTEAFALRWPNSDTFLLYQTETQAEEDRKWFSKNYRTDSDGLPRGEPYVVRLVEQEAQCQLI